MLLEKTRDMENKKELNYIKDCEINLEKDDLLSTHCYVDTILQIIKNATTPFTIGLFGGWGSGKSSIIKTIKEKFNKDENNKTKVFVYDAWKYSKDSFRRTFILELKKEFHLEEDSNYQDFYNNKHEDIAHKNQIDPKKTFFGLLYLLPILLFIVWFIPQASLDLQIALSVISIISTIIFYFLKDVYVQYKISVTKPKTFAPEQFEDAFDDAVRIITSPTATEKFKNWFKKGNKTIFAEKIVLVIDNVDRCHDDLAFTLLLTIKNFLEKEGVIFIVPVDEEEMKKYLTQKGYDANEFLRKLFNTTLNIKKFSESDLYSFAKSLNNKYNLNLPENVISLVAQEFSKNPRRIIQFLNVLQTEILFSKKQESSGNIPKGIISNNLPFLTKVLLIREEWFDLYKSLRENPYLLEDINQSLKEGLKIKFTKIDDDQLRFLERTRHITTKNPEAFFVNKDVFSDIPDELNKLVVSQGWKEIKEFLNKEKLTFEKLMEFIDEIFNRDVVGRGLIDTTGFNIFSLIFKIANDKEFSDRFNELYYTDSKSFGNIKSKLNCSDIAKLANQFKAKDLFGFIKTNLEQNQTLLNTIIQYFQNAVIANKDNYELFREFILTFADMPEYLDKVGNKFSEAIIANPNYFDDFEPILKKDEIINSLVKPNLLKEFISSLEVDRSSNNTEIKVRIIKSFEKSNIFSVSLAEEFINKTITLLNSTSDYNVIEFWLDALSGLISKTKKQEIHDNVFDALNTKYSLFANNYPAQYNSEKYIESLSKFLDISKELYKGNKATNNATVLNWLTAFFSKNDEQKIYLHINKIYSEFIKYFTIWNWPFAQQEIDKFNQLSEWKDKEAIADVLNLMSKKTKKDKGLDQDKIKSIFLNYVSAFKTQEDKEDEILEWINLIIQNDIVKEQIVEIINNFDFKEKLNILKIIKNVDKDLLKKSVNEIILNSECSDLQEALNKFYTSKINKTIIKNSVKTILNNLSKENDEVHFKCFLEFIANNDLIDRNITSTIINKVRPLLGATNEEIVFSLKIIDKLKNIDDKKKKMIKTILEGLDENDFNDEEKKLLSEIKKKL
ncbi:MAG: hypothetical protein KAU07_00435 [Candidatus Andersenbacteria bacterium]|nr:hypothetical protein [Candidatus Andersenbacteria bacterium]